MKTSLIVDKEIEIIHKCLFHIPSSEYEVPFVSHFLHITQDTMSSQQSSLRTIKSSPSGQTQSPIYRNFQSRTAGSRSNDVILNLIQKAARETKTTLEEPKVATSSPSTPIQNTATDTRSTFKQLNNNSSLSPAPIEKASEVIASATKSSSSLQDGKAISVPHIAFAPSTSKTRGKECVLVPSLTREKHTEPFKEQIQEEMEEEFSKVIALATEDEEYWTTYGPPSPSEEVMQGWINDMSDSEREEFERMVEEANEMADSEYVFLEIIRDRLMQEKAPKPVGSTILLMMSGDS